MILVGVDWSEAHHDVCVLDEQGTVLAKGKVSDDVFGVGRLHAMVAEHVEGPSEVVVGIETTEGCSWDRSSTLATGSTRSTRWPPRGTGTVTPFPGRSPTLGTPRFWPSSCAPTGRTIGRSPVTPSSPRP